jgi:hypothetical protein
MSDLPKLTFKFAHMTRRAKPCRGITFDPLSPPSHLQLAFYLNKTVWYLQQQDISASFLNDEKKRITSYSVHPTLRDPSITMLYVTEAELLKALKMTILGISSVFHTWDSSSERFVQAGIGEGKRGTLMIDGKDEMVSQR